MWQLPPDIYPENIIDYLRKSRTDDPTLDVEEVLAKHEQMLDEWVEKSLPGKGKVPEENRFREVVSGETIDSRPRMQEMLRKIESPNIKAILAVEPQRLSRGDLEDIGRLVKLLRYTNTIVITLQYIYDLRDERDRDMFERELMRGNEFLEYQKRIMNNGRLLSVKNGNFIGQSAPYGYNKIQVKEDKKKYFTLEPDPDTAPVVKLIFDMYRSGNGTTRIADKLNEAGIPAQRIDKWGPESIAGILRNEHYLGKVVWNKRPKKKKVVEGEVVVSRARSNEYLIYDGKHPAIVDQETWDAVQEMLGKIPPNKKAHNFFNPLAGILYCEKCGKVMARRQYTDKTGKQRCAPRFACVNQRTCCTASSKMEDVIPEVVKYLQYRIANFEIEIKKGKDDSAETHRKLIARTEKRLAELRELEIKQWDEKIKGDIPAHIFERINKQTTKEIEDTEKSLNKLRETAPEPEDLEAKVKTFYDALEALKNPDVPARQQNKLLKACLERIDYHREQLNRGYKLNGNLVAPIKLHFRPRF